MKKIIIYILGVILFSCDNKIIENEVVDDNKITEIVDGIADKDKVSQKILYIGETNYMKAFYNNPVIGYSSSTSDPLSESKFVTFDGSIKTPLTKTSLWSNINALINGRNIFNLKLTTKTQSQDIVSDLYGKEVSFTISPITKSLDNSVESISLYIPNIVKITSPKIETEEALYPYCYYKDFLLGWNSDLKNENGLVVIVEWYGTYFNSGQNENRYVRNVDLILVDDGEEVLNNALFDDIPDDALCYITLLRGNLENIELPDNLAYLVGGESHAVLPLVLVRNL
jgi:hypothetical protein